MSKGTRYIALCVVGLVLPYSQFTPWSIEHGFDLPLFARELFANRVSAFFALDVVVSAIVLFVFMRSEAQRSPVRHLWAPVVGTLLVGVSFGLPLFLYLRERHAAAAPVEAR